MKDVYKEKEHRRVGRGNTRTLGNHETEMVIGPNSQLHISCNLPILNRKIKSPLGPKTCPIGPKTGPIVPKN